MTPRGRAAVTRRSALLVGLAAALAGCSALRGSDDEESDTGYVSGDGSVQSIPERQRGGSVAFAGTSVEGLRIDVEAWRGHVVVLNLWYAACGPCREEAPDLVAIAAETESDQVEFLGINTRDGAAEASAFQRTFSVPYPSILDAEGAVVLALRGELVPNAVPTTLVLDARGRVAARVTGVVDASVLRTLISTTLAEMELR